MIKIPCHRLGLLSASVTVCALIASCGESSLGPDSNAQASGGSGAASPLLAAAPCLACADPKCPTEAKNCSSNQGCGDIAACLLACSISGTACSSQCSTNNSSNANASSAAAAYAACAIVACPNACTPLAGTGGNGSIGQGGNPTGSGGQATGSGGTNAASGGTGTGSGGTTPVSTNLIQDPDFSAVSAYWSATANGGDAASMSCSGGQCCVTNEYSTWFAFSLGYPRSSLQAFPIQGGATYTLSFRARGSMVNSVEAKVGEAVSPYATVYSSLVSVSSTLSLYSRQFTASSTVTAAGLVFNVELAEYGSICFSGVSLAKN